MAWLCKDTPVVDGEDPIIDIQKTIEDWAWNHFVTNTGSFRRMFLVRSKFVVDVPMNYYLFEDSETKFVNVNPDPNVKVKDVTTTAQEKEQRLDITDPNVSILATKYVNDTGKDQVYKFRMERTRKAVVTISCQKGFSISGQAKFSIGVADGQVNSKFEVTNIRQQVFEQTLLFETSSDINVEGRTDCTAMVVFTERETRMKFKLETKMSLASDSAPIYIRRKKDNKLFAMIKLTNLKNVFMKYAEKKTVELIADVRPDAVGDLYRVHNVKLFTEGIIEGVRLSDQTVKLRALKIEENSTEIGTKNEELNKHNTFHNPS